MASLSLENVTKRFPDGTTAVDQVNLQIEDREFLVLVGPSGCGKSTTLRMIAGLETITGGVIRISDRVVNEIAPKDRDIAMVFQNYALYPHMSVYKNLSFGLYLRYGGNLFVRALRRIFKPGKAAELARLRSGVDGLVRDTARRLGIEHLLNRKPHQLSGGERQRVALGRAIVRKPKAFLFDEPLSNLDAKLRQQMRVELKRLHQDIQTTMIYVTHDQVEAMTLGDRVAVMEQGRVLQVGKPLEIYQQPANLFVARFFGSVPINLWQGFARRRNQGIAMGGPEGPAPFCFEAFASKPGEPVFSFGDQESREVTLGVRAENLAIEANQRSANVFGKVVAIDRLGDSAVIHLRTNHKLDSQATGKPDLHGRFLEPDGIVYARVPVNIPVNVGQELGLKINDPASVNWFDPQSGDNLLKD